MKKDGLKEYNRRLVSESKPLKEIEEMMKAGEWNQYSKLLTAENKKHLYSSPKPWKCAEEKLTSQYFWSNSYSCTSSIYNDLYAGFSTFSYAAQRNEKDFAVIASITIANPDTVNFYFEIPTIIIGSAKFE